MSQVMLKDPGVSFGRFKLLPRTDGWWCIYDPKRPFGDRTEFAHHDRELVEARMKELALAAGEWTEPVYASPPEPKP